VSGQLEGKVILISGASGGLGEPVARAFLAAGAGVAGTARKWPSPPDGRFAAITADLTTESGCADAVSKTLARFGKLDAVVHLMGGFAADGPVESTRVETWDGMMSLNLRSAFLLFRAAIPVLARPGGQLIAIGSQAAVTLPAGLSAYAVSKAGVHALMQVLASEGERAGFEAHLIAPGTIDTPANRASMPDADRSQWTKPEEIAARLIELCGDRNL
jgi:NAD(P)-dependent dehydrogenase (short-subunit alcohol dehydrogenase family)